MDAFEILCQGFVASKKSFYCLLNKNSEREHLLMSKTLNRSTSQYIDLVAAVSILYMAGAFVWGYYFDIDANLSLRETESHRPLYLWLMIADIIPCIAAFFWLLWKYQDTLDGRFQLLRKKWFLVLLVLAVLAIDTIKHHMEGRPWLN